MLSQIGFEVFEARHGLEALERLEEIGQADVLLVDWNMPEMNGYELLCSVRAHPSYRRLPVMMVTAETEIDQMVKALSAGANEYVMKPFSKEILAEKLNLLGLVP